jgi:hypothetical protein
VEIDRFGFVWLSFSTDPALDDADFSLFPTEVTMEGR